MKLSRSSMYAVKALLELGSAPPGVKVTCHQLAENGHMPERFLLQILRNLVTSGLLKSTRGVHGGYRLGRPSQQISILDVFEAVDGPLRFETAMDKGSNGTMRELIGEIGSRIRRQLDELRLSSFLGEQIEIELSEAVPPANQLVGSLY